MTKDPLDALQAYFGYQEFRENQRGIVDAVLGGRDVLAVMPTGAGKSLCYQVPALCMDGLTLVVSPLISLMKDQVQALRQAGVAAEFLNSSLSPSDREEVLQLSQSGAVKLLYVSPERLETSDFLRFCQAMPPSLIAVDEAHCISQWGQDFRPSYTAIRGFVESLPVRPPLAAFTATATQAVRDDIATSLALRDPYTVVASFDRPNLHFEVRRPKDKDAELLRICRDHAGACGIVYCSSRNAVEEVCDYLQENGVSATRYHAGLGTAERRRNQDDFVFDRASVIVATNAFGMGIDKSNVGFVVHYNLPLDLESYYQEAGRAGRDGEPADCVLLYAPRDVRTCEFLARRGIAESEVDDPQVRAMLEERAGQRLRQMTFYATTTDCLRGFILRYFGENAPGYCGNCGNCETEFEERDVSLDAQKIVSCVYRVRQTGRSVGRSTIVDILRGSKAEKILNWGFDQLSTYGLMEGSSTKHVRFVLDSLIERGVLATSGGDYPTVAFTNESGLFLREKRPFVIKVPKEREKPAPEKKSAKGTVPVDEGLFGALKALRLRLAEDQGVPAYVVFSNAALTDMCAKRPATHEEFLQVSGVGAKKDELYGDAFLQAIADYEQQKA